MGARQVGGPLPHPARSSGNRAQAQRLLSESRLSFRRPRTMSQSTIPTLRTLDPGALVRDCVAHVRPPLPPSCVCKTSVRSRSLPQVDLTVLVPALSLLLQAAALRLRAAPDPDACPRLSLRVKASVDLTVVRLGYSAPTGASREADAYEALALEALESLGGAASFRSTRRW